MKPAAIVVRLVMRASPMSDARRRRATTTLVGLGLLAGMLGLTGACEKRTTGRDLTSKPGQEASVAQTSPGTAAAPAAERKRYGAALAPGEAVAIADVLAKPEAFTARTVTVEGHVRKACTRKGCWMELGARDQATPGARITFKDYGFFVPTDSAGAEARVQGSVQLDTLSAAAVRHYEEEGAVFPGKKPDGTAPEVRLVATGVEMWRSAQN
ncbi:MAG TPA: DUF4920 domain-containing protein [Polyangia bacterium]